ncbi:hypothetical protein ACFX5Q_07395 [Mesorhizobium sp. IMUNJ 23033]|uniref:hypothetical protein n=1 Tax=Mesorhizobium sp. IMUNJ 23033 TaxID=3378039 RepID=UPI00385111AF
MSLSDNEKAGPLATGPALKIEVVERKELRRKPRKPQANAITPQQRWRNENPWAVWSHSAYRSALRRGLIERQPCEVCGTTDNVDGHHPDYRKPADVIWVCRLHHRREHLRLKCEAAS